MLGSKGHKCELKGHAPLYASPSSSKPWTKTRSFAWSGAGEMGAGIKMGWGAVSYMDMAERDVHIIRLCRPLACDWARKLCCAGGMRIGLRGRGGGGAGERKLYFVEV